MKHTTIGIVSRISQNGCNKSILGIVSDYPINNGDKNFFLISRAFGNKIINQIKNSSKRGIVCVKITIETK